MKFKYVAWLIAGSVALGACTHETVSQPGGVMEPATPTMMTVTLNEQNDLGQSGQATLVENEDGQVTVTLNMMGGEFPTAQPAHIHIGNCPEPGAVQYPLLDVVGGTSETVLDVSMEELLASSEMLAINVHKSAPEASVYTACGDIQ